MLYLGQQDIDNLISLDELMDTIETSFKVYEKKDFHMPNRIHVHNNENTILYMPCFTSHIFGTKILTVFPKNPQKALPAIQGIMLLNDINTGQIVSAIDGAILTAYRTGAVGGLGIKYTTKQNCKSVGLVGAGVQGFYQLLFATKARNIKNIYIFDIFKDKLEPFKERLIKRLPHIEINIVNNSEELLEKSEIIITTTTSKKPVLPNNEKLLKGKHFIAIGSYKPDMRELPEALFKILDKIYIDTDFAMEESGDLITPVENNWISTNDIKTFGKCLLDKSNSFSVDGKTTLFKSVGMALFDLLVSETIYKKAVEKGFGQNILL